MLYEHRKHDGTLPLVGVNTFLKPEDPDAGPVEIELMRATEAEKESQLERLADFQARNADQAPEAIRLLQDVATGDGNVFDALMAAARVCSLGQLTEAFFEVGGQYRRNM
jgi:methylmalonyl-CoA mutase